MKKKTHWSPVVAYEYWKTAMFGVQCSVMDWWINNHLFTRHIAFWSTISIAQFYKLDILLTQYLTSPFNLIKWIDYFVWHLILDINDNTFYMCYDTLSFKERESNDELYRLRKSFFKPSTMQAVVLSNLVIPKCKYIDIKVVYSKFKTKSTFISVNTFSFFFLLVCRAHRTYYHLRLELIVGCHHWCDMTIDDYEILWVTDLTE